MSDVTLIARAWDKHGQECLDYLHGDFAAALFEEATGQLHMFRDISGQRPLLFLVDGDQVAFASMPSGLIATGLCPGFNLDFIALLLMEIGPVEDGTPLAKVRRIAPGEHVQVAQGRVLRRNYWKPPSGRSITGSRTELVERFRAELDRAVASRLDCHSGHAATHLSSGFDSAAVTSTAAIIAARQPQKLTAYTAAPAGPSTPDPGRQADESGLADLVARTGGIRHVVVRSTSRPLKTWRSQVIMFQDPFLNHVNTGWWNDINRDAQGRGADVMLTGAVGNVTLHWGGNEVLRQFVELGEWRSWLKEAMALWRRKGARLRGILWNSFEPDLPRRLAAFLRGRFTPAAHFQAGEFLRPEVRARIAEARRAFIDQPDPGDSGKVRAARLALMDRAIHRKGSLAAYGIDERDPLTDRRLVEFSFAIGPENYLSGGQSRPLATEALSDRLPPAVLTNPNRGYQGADWRALIPQADARQLLEEVAEDELFRSFVDIDKLRQAIEQWPRSDDRSVATRIRYSHNIPLVLATGVYIQEMRKLGVGTHLA